jgi:hypothetical protein
MEPKTRIQKEVHKIHTSLKPITKKQLEWAYSKSQSHSVIHQNKFYCLECGHIQKLDSSWEGMLMKIENRTVCSKCKTTAKPHVGKLPFRKSVESFEYLTTHKGWQVIRIVYMYKHVKKGVAATVDTHEVIQHWVNEKGDIISYAKPTFGMSRYIDQFILHEPLKLRSSQFKRSRLYAISGSHIYPRCTLLNIVKRNGFNNKASDLIASQDLIPKILKDNKAETLIKTRQYELLKRYIISNDLQYWNQIKIAIRNNYIVNNVNDWYDYLRMLTALRKDIHNPKYVCPTDFYEAHQKVLAKHQELRRKQKLAKLIEEIEIDNEEYIKQKQFFFDLHFKYDNVSVEVIKSVKQVFDEGEQLHHCVFENKYHQKQHSLLLSAKVDNTVVETIEVNLELMEISQSRGLHNKPSDYNEIIVNLVNQNLKKIKKVYKQVKQAA